MHLFKILDSECTKLYVYLFVAYNKIMLIWFWRQCQRFWGASGDFWQAAWDRFLDTVGEDHVTLWVYSTTILTIGVYWLFGGIYTFLDVTNKPAALRRYKIQPGTNEPVDRRRLLKVPIAGRQMKCLVRTVIS